MSAAATPPLVLTMGEPAGIGGEIALMAWRARGSGTPPFFMIDNPPRLADLCRRLDWAVPLATLADPADTPALFGDALPVLPIELPTPPRPGALDAANAGAVIEAIDRAIDLVSRERKASTSFIQRHLQIGYNRAARIIEQMEAEGVVSKANHVGKREVLTRDPGDDY